MNNNEDNKFIRMPRIGEMKYNFIYNDVVIDWLINEYKNGNLSNQEYADVKRKLSCLEGRLYSAVDSFLKIISKFDKDELNLLVDNIILTNETRIKERTNPIVNIIDILKEIKMIYDKSINGVIDLFSCDDLNVLLEDESMKQLSQIANSSFELLTINLSQIDLIKQFMDSYLKFEKDIMFNINGRIYKIINEERVRTEILCSESKYREYRKNYLYNVYYNNKNKGKIIKRK